MTERKGSEAEAQRNDWKVVRQGVLGRPDDRVSGRWETDRAAERRYAATWHPRIRQTSLKRKPSGQTGLGTN